MSKDQDKLYTIAAQVQNYLAYLADQGFTGVDCSAGKLERVFSWGRNPDAIAAAVKNCRGCPLAGKGGQAIAGAGDQQARIMFVGGWPEPEDAQNDLPFSGRAGQLLNRMIQAMGFSRDTVYLSFAVKCRPPGDNRPEFREVMACRRFLESEIAAVGPEVICTLGDIALQALIGENASCEAGRGRFTSFRDTALMPTYSPAHLLAEPSAKRLTWQDMKQVLDFLGLKPAAGRQGGSAGGKVK
ncbi:MAG: uracil-DNA glycosylase [Desulfosalsimonadaceae bacterium]